MNISTSDTTFRATRYARSQCMPDVFTRYSITVDGSSAGPRMGDLTMPLRAGQVVVISDGVKGETHEVPVAFPPPTRAVLSFEYGESFKGCDAVYSKKRLGVGFIAPTLRLEDDPRTTPFAAVRGESDTLADWPGWSRYTEREDLYARWLELER